EGVAKEQFVIFWVKEGRAAGGNLSPRNAPDNRSGRLDRLFHFDASIPLNERPVLTEPGAQPARSLFLTPCPDEAGTGDRQSVGVVLDGHSLTIERVGVFKCVHPKGKLQSRKFHRRLGKIEAELREALAAGRDVNPTAGTQGKDVIELGGIPWSGEGASHRGGPIRGRKKRAGSRNHTLEQSSAGNLVTHHLLLLRVWLNLVAGTRPSQETGLR